MSRDLPPLKYSQLSSDQIRLLAPQFDDAGNLTWKLESVQLPTGDADGETVTLCDYDALSYTWGAQDQTFHINCNGQALGVHRNLNSALPFLARRLQQADSPPRRIWIDAVCINQHDDDEKMIQIGRMASIYRRATQLIVWFGPGHGAHNNETAIALLPRIIEVGKATFAYLMDSRQPEPDFSYASTPDASSPVWGVLCDILFNDWYSRLWVVQEVAMARSTVGLVGDRAFDLDTVETALGFMLGILANQSEKLGPGLDILRREGLRRGFDFLRLLDNMSTISIRGYFHRSRDIEFQRTSVPQGPSSTTSDCSPSPQVSVLEGSDHLLHALHLTTMSHKCFDPRDRVFGVLGFAEHTAQVDKIGLHHNMDIAELYTVFVSYVFVHSGRPSFRKFLWELLSYACLPNKTVTLPSWCPDLQVQREPSTPFSLTLLGKRGFSKANENNALGFTSHDYIYTADTEEVDIRQGSSQNEIVVKGTLFDVVTDVYPAFPDIKYRLDIHLTDYFQMHATIGEWEKSVADKVLGPPGDGKGARVSLDTYWHTLVGNVTNLAAGDLEFTYETLYALRDFHDRMTRLKIKFEELADR